MTCREKLRIEHPDKVDVSFTGDCFGCPDHYGYLGRPNCSKISCRDCWDREIPDTDIPVKTMLENAFEDMEREFEGWVSGEADNSVNYEDTPRLPKEEITELINIVEKAMDDKPRILDSGNRRQFESGAVRDIAEGKGRCDLLPLDVVAIYIEEDNDTVDWVLMHINNFQENGSMHYLYSALLNFTRKRGWDDHTMLLEVAKHFEEGSRKYGDNNWQKGIPVRCYVDSAVRHYLKFLRGDIDEPHDRAVCWNLMCGIWTCKHKPELNEYGKEEK